MAANQFNVTELDFDKIKASIIDHFKSQSKYNDWDFTGSGLSMLVDILAYNTHYNAVMAQMSLNETFLDSAQIRGNVVSHAKLLGYVPRSSIASTATVNVTVTADSGAPEFIALERGTGFSTVVDSVKYSFVALDSLTAPLIEGEYNFENVVLKQGTLKRMIYRADSTIESQKFVIPDASADTTTIRVRVKSNEEANDYSIYTRFITLSNIGSESQIYFLQENSAGQFEIYFGDNAIGKKPASNSIIEIEYVYTSGEAANGADAFVATDSIGGYTDIAVEADEPSYGGASRESIDSIRYNAPLTFISQNRAVTADDYRALILKDVANIESISVWGGEDAETPDYGRVYIAIKPTGAEVLTSDEKAYISGTVLKGKNVVSITPIILDPIYTYLSLDVSFKYNPNLTDRTQQELIALVRDTVSTYNDNNLQRFDGVFRYSQLLRDIDTSDPSILNSVARVYMFKKVTPSISGSNYFDLVYSSPIFNNGGSESVLTSTPITIAGTDYFIADVPDSVGNTRTVYLYKVVGASKIRVKDIGKIYPAEGRVVLSDFIPDTTDEITITAIPNSDDLAPKRNQLLDIDMLSTTIIGEVDTIAVAGSAGAITYQTAPRVR